MKIVPADKEALQLLQEGTIALAEIEANGIRIDTKYLTKAIEQTTREIKELEEQLKASKVWKQWRRRFGEKSTLGNRKQLGTVVFDILGHKRTRGNNDEEAFDHVDEPFVKDYFRLAKKQKMKGTYLSNIQEEVDENGFLHAVYNLNIVSSYRSSAEAVNWQNLPIRDPEMGRTIRSCVISRKGHRLVESDFGGIEVSGIACHCLDPVLINYIKDPTKDMHRDMAAECYLVPVDKVNKTTRYCAKNQFVFPQFYGSYYVDCAKSLWASVMGMNLKVGDTLMGDWLESKGITSLGRCAPDQQPRKGTFEYHIKQVEERFWKKFHVYAKWKKDTWNEYLRKGYIKTKTGFVLQGVMRRNQILNMGNQGSCFHILLKSLILLLKRMKKLRMKSKLVGQIHDCVLGDIREDELQDYLHLVKEVTTEVVPKLWDWIIVPLKIEAEVCEKNWYEKYSWELKNNTWQKVSK